MAIILFKVVDDIFTEGAAGVAAVADEEKSVAAIIGGIIGGFLLNVVSSLAIGSACGIDFCYV